MDDCQFLHIYERIISLDNLFSCWNQFRRGKRNKLDVLGFERHLEDNIFLLHEELKNQTYRHKPYTTFHISDPKHRIISKADVRDRLVHHVVFNELYAIFDPTFIFHSYACRLNKGTHLAVNQLNIALRKVSRNYTIPAFALKCDILKFFYSVPHQKLLHIIQNKIKDSQLLWLIKKIISSFTVDNFSRERARGIPIGNLTSQIFANIYLNKLDQFIKHQIRAKYYFRYADDFIIVSDNWDYLASLTRQINKFLYEQLNLRLHPDKLTIRKFGQGIDFLGYVILPYHKALRTRTKKRMFRKISKLNKASYIGLLKHCNGYKLEQEITGRVSGV